MKYLSIEDIILITLLVLIGIKMSSNSNSSNSLNNSNNSSSNTSISTIDCTTFTYVDSSATIFVAYKIDPTNSVLSYGASIRKKKNDASNESCKNVAINRLAKKPVKIMCLDLCRLDGKDNNKLQYIVRKLIADFNVKCKTKPIVVNDCRNYVKKHDTNYLEHKIALEKKKATQKMKSVKVEQEKISIESKIVDDEIKSVDVFDPSSGVVMDCSNNNDDNNKEMKTKIKQVKIYPTILTNKDYTDEAFPELLESYITHAVNYKTFLKMDKTNNSVKEAKIVAFSYDPSTRILHYAWSCYNTKDHNTNKNKPTQTTLDPTAQALLSIVKAQRKTLDPIAQALLSIIETTKTTTVPTPTPTKTNKKEVYSKAKGKMIALKRLLMLPNTINNLTIDVNNIKNQQEHQAFCKILLANFHSKNGGCRATRVKEDKKRIETIENIIESNKSIHSKVYGKYYAHYAKINKNSKIYKSYAMTSTKQIRDNYVEYHNSTNHDELKIKKFDNNLIQDHDKVIHANETVTL